MADLVPTSQNYQKLLADLRNQILTAQVRTALSVNRELILLYWGIGKEILSRQQEDAGHPRHRPLGEGPALRIPKHAGAVGP